MTWLDGLTFDTVIVHTTDDKSIRGAKAGVYEDGMLLRDAVYLEGESADVIPLYFVAREVFRGMQIIEAPSKGRA
jgi:hypothetical protein